MRSRRAVRGWLIAHSSVYRRWIRWRFDRAVRRVERTIGRELALVLGRAAADIQRWLNGER